jgi:hypothetical protein
MTKAEIKEIAKQVYKEEQEYQQLFKTMLAKSGKDINSMSDEEKKKFFTAVDKAYKAKSEGKLYEGKKKSLNEDLFTGVLSTVGIILIGKLLFYWFYTLAEKGIKFFSGKKENKDMVVNILNKISDNKSFIADVSKMIDVKNGINSTTAEKIVKMMVVQNAIKSTVSDDKIKKEIETELKSIFLKAWNDTSIMNPVVSKVKNDIKK